MENGEKIRITAKRIDHLERAYRKEELKHLPEDYAAQRELDLKAYEDSRDGDDAERGTEAQGGCGAQASPQPTVGPSTRPTGRTSLLTRHADFEKRRKDAERELNQKMEQRRREVRAERAEQRRRAEEEERARREEEERLAREAEEAEREAEEKKRKDAEAKAEAEKRRQERMEAARKQMEREEEAERRRRERRDQERGGAAPPSRFGAGERPSLEGLQRRSGPPPAEEPVASHAPRLNLAGPSGKPSWRDREAARASGQSPAPAPAPAESTPSPPPAEAPKRTGYIPPALRGQPPATGDAMPPPPDRSESPATGSGSGGAYRPPGARGQAGAGGSSGGAYRPPGRR